MSKEVLNKLYRNMAIPFIILAFMLTTLNRVVSDVKYNLDAGEINAYLCQSIQNDIMMLETVITLFCVALYIFFYYLVRKYYDGDDKKRFLRWAVFNSVLCPAALLLGIFI